MEHFCIKMSTNTYIFVGLSHHPERFQRRSNADKSGSLACFIWSLVAVSSEVGERDPDKISKHFCLSHVEIPCGKKRHTVLSNID